MCRTNISGYRRRHSKASRRRFSDVWENLLVSMENDKVELWVAPAKDSTSTVMELLQGMEDHVDQEQKAVEKLQSLALLSEIRQFARRKAPERVVLRSGCDLLP